ncbi:Cytoplasmic dynein 1 light intermediate chain 2 [Triplophysa tibetana]|uniref:Dynein light intermediate chain n=1 Tax=Triplophysa tibetana TaxID=1572043 RepID=A0A5A9NPZ4_9TELE|nr:Cytoplasmic dynein 1 light intermediate chain 2 [Triplophysa tibetana]
MATTGRNTLLSASTNVNNSTSESQNPEDDDGQNLWSSILSEVSTRSRSKLPSGKNVVVMGEVGSGKTTLVAKLQGVEEYMKGRGLEYLYFSVHDDDIDDHARCNAWVLDGDLYHKGLQKFAVSTENLADSLVLFVVDLSRPWLALDSLQKWGSVVRDYLDKLRVPPETMRELEHRLVKQFQEYVEPGSDLDGVPQRRNPESEEESVLLPLGDNTLTNNMGLTIVVVCNKVRQLHQLTCVVSLKFVFNSNVGFNKYFYSSGQKYMRWLYGFPFDIPAQVVEKDSVFIPSGWDNEKKIGILHENFQTLKADDNFEDVIVKPPVRKDPTNRAPTGSPRTTNRSAAANVANVMPMQSGTKKIDPNVKGGQTSEGVLANFFNSLLTKKAGSPSPGAQPTGGGGNTPGTVRKSGSKLGLTDVQAELDRISNKSDLDSAPNATTPPAENDES